jgi:dienelactone hydrolase
LPAATEEQAKQIKARIVVCHGANDKFISADSIARFQAALNKSGADYEFISYANTVHSFSNPGADKRNIPGLKYNAKADQRSWRQMRLTFDDVFGK